MWDLSILTKSLKILSIEEHWYNRVTGIKKIQDEGTRLTY